MKIGDHPEHEEDDAVSAALTDGRQQRAERSGVLLVRGCGSKVSLLTVDLERSLRRLADGDRIGNEEPATFNPHKCGRHGH